MDRKGGVLHGLVPLVACGGISECTLQGRGFGPLLSWSSVAAGGVDPALFASCGGCRVDRLLDSPHYITMRIVWC